MNNDDLPSSPVSIVFFVIFVICCWELGKMFGKIITQAVVSF